MVWPSNCVGAAWSPSTAWVIGHAMLMLDGMFGSGRHAAEAAAEQAAAATLALISGRECLTPSS